MKNLIAFRKNDAVKNTLLFIVGVSFMLVWLPLLRCAFDGESYAWGVTYFGIVFKSVGVQADYWFVLAQLVFFIALYYSAYWVQKRVIFYALLATWFIHVFGSFLFTIFSEGDVMFHGDTLNVHISIGTLVTVLAVIAFALIVWTVIRDYQAEEVQIPWSKKNTIWMYILLGPIALQIVLLATGEPHGSTDDIGVIIAIAQALFMFNIFRSYASSDSLDASGTPSLSKAA